MAFTMDDSYLVFLEFAECWERYLGEVVIDAE